MPFAQHDDHGHSSFLCYCCFCVPWKTLSVGTLQGAPQGVLALPPRAGGAERSALHFKGFADFSGLATGLLQAGPPARQPAENPPKPDATLPEVLCFAAVPTSPPLVCHIPSSMGAGSGNIAAPTRNAAVSYGCVPCISFDVHCSSMCWKSAACIWWFC